MKVMLLWCRPHPSLQAKSSCSNSPCKYRRSLSSNLPPDYDKDHTSPLTLCCSLKSVYLWPLGHGIFVCTHGTTILTNREPSEVVGERIFYALQARTWTIRKISVWNFFSLYITSITTLTHSFTHLSFPCSYQQHAWHYWSASRARGFWHELQPHLCDMRWPSGVQAAEGAHL